MLQILLHVVPIIQSGPEFELETNPGTGTQKVETEISGFTIFRQEIGGLTIV